MSEKQTKLASYWNTPFDKICLGIKVNNVTKWIVIDHKASSLFNVIADRVFRNTTVEKDKWLSLMNGSLLQEYCNTEGFNVFNTFIFNYQQVKVKVRIGIITNNEDDCDTCDSCIGFGALLRGCDGGIRKTTCGNIAVCGFLHNKNTPAFGYILVQ